MSHITLEEVVVDAGPGPWWIAHEYPERPADVWTIWDWSCTPCVVHLLAAEFHDPGHVADLYEAGELTVHATVGDAVNACMAWRAEHGMGGP